MWQELNLHRSLVVIKWHVPMTPIVHTGHCHKYTGRTDDDHLNPDIRLISLICFNHSSNLWFQRSSTPLILPAEVSSKGSQGRAVGQMGLVSVVDPPVSLDVEQCLYSRQ